MSHGPSGRCGVALAPAPACAPNVNVAPISVSGSASIGTRVILIFMFVLFAMPSCSGMGILTVPGMQCKQIEAHGFYRSQERRSGVLHRSNGRNQEIYFFVSCRQNGPKPPLLVEAVLVTCCESCVGSIFGRGLFDVVQDED